MAMTLIIVTSVTKGLDPADNHLYGKFYRVPGGRQCADRGRRQDVRIEEPSLNMAQNPTHPVQVPH